MVPYPERPYTKIMWVPQSMWHTSLALQSLTAFFLTLAVIIAMAPIAHKFGLVDSPSTRKRHIGDIPLVGGIAVFIVLSAVLALWGAGNASQIVVNQSETLWTFTSCSAFLVFTGILDDKFQLGVFVRVASELVVAVAVIEALDLQMQHLGNLLGTGGIFLEHGAAYLFTTIAIFGVINAFNMLDGLDGLLSCLVITTVVLFHAVTGTQPGFISLAVTASLAAFLVSNLGMSPLVPKCFLGDAGSKLLGFIVVCLLLSAASDQVGAPKLIKPVTALFLVALPLYDMVFTSLRRILAGRSPFTADHSHIHHLTQGLGMSDRQSLITILAIHSSIILVGLILHRAGTPEYYQFAIFMGGFGLYCLLCSQLWHSASEMLSIRSALETVAGHANVPGSPNYAIESNVDFLSSDTKRDAL